MIGHFSSYGDYKKAFESLTNSYVEDFDDLIAQVPKEAQTTLEPYRTQVIDAFDKQKKTLEDRLASVGTDSTKLPSATKESLVKTLKTMRDQLKEAMKTAREQAKSLMK